MAKILIIEDDKGLTALLQTILEKEGHLTMSASSGKTALDWISNSRPDLALLDVGLPDMSGLEVCKKIKGEYATRKIPVIILTGNVDNQTKIQANLSAKADLFLNKPIENKDIISAIDLLLKKSLSDKAIIRSLFKRNNTN
ncbi:MAG: response regulator transcription factor [Elusimicrobiota bacterium]|nr:response regulator transcription factor [Elusimicrobiota bacterium]